MSIRKWGVLKENGKLVNIDNLDKSYKGKVICYDTNCHCDLILNIGEKKDPYFRHPANIDCQGGSAESILHKLAKDVIANSIKLYVPSCQYGATTDRLVNVDQEYLVDVKSCEVYIEAPLIEDSSLKPDVVLETSSGELFCVEVYVAHKVPESKINKYMNLSGSFHVIEIDLREYKDIDKYSYEELADAITMKASRKIIASNNLADVIKRVKDAEFYATGDKAICPCQNAVVSTKDCRFCAFYINSSRGTMKCLGKGCYSKASDIEKNRSAEELYDIYCEGVPEPIGEIDYNVNKTPFGLCKKCNEPLVLAMGYDDEDNYNNIIAGLTVIHKKTSSAFTYCPNCNEYHKLECPVCKKENKARLIGYDIKVKKNRKKGNVYLCCENYRTAESFARHGRDLEYAHNYSLSVYTSTPIKNNYTDEILACDLNTFLTKPEKAEKILSEVRGFNETKGYKSETGVYQR